MIGYSPLNHHYLLFYLFCLPCRCMINGCDVSETAFEYWPPWVNHAVPFDADDYRLSKCSRYVLNNFPNNTNTTDRRVFRCDESDFNKSSSVQCDEFVFESGGETTIVSAVLNNICIKKLNKL